MEKWKKNDMLEIILVDELSPEQASFRPMSFVRPDSLFVFRMLKEPRYLHDIDWELYRRKNITIWRDNNGTLISVGPSAHLLYEERNVCFEMIRSSDILQTTLKCAIYGKTDATIAETATFFWSLPDKRDRDPRLAVGTFQSYNPEHVFDFSALQPEQLVSIMDANPKRVIEIHNGIWSTEQAETLVTRPYPIHLKFVTLHGSRKVALADGRRVCAFKDGGRAFVEALEQRQSSFGSLFITYDRNACDKGEMPVAHEYLERILKLDIFESFAVGPILDKECALLPFVMTTDALHYEISAKTFESSHFASLRIVPRELSITLNLDGLHRDDWHRYVIAFLNRLSELGHLERLDLSLGRSSWDYYRDMLNRIVQALIGVIHTNPRLKRLSLFDNSCSSLEWTFFLQILYRAMETHESLLSFRTKRCWSDDVDSSLVQLLSRNQNISVYDQTGKRCFTQNIGKIYRDRFYHTSTELGKAPPSVRTSLVITALIETALEHYQRAATLLFNHTDILCEMLQDNVDTFNSSQPIAGESPSEAFLYRSHKRTRHCNVLYEF
ncbi:hypothetical protein FisN_26Lh153 [Fistulifera solaris]|uniref:Uncharacterized protein n=1 Tax=Fistulifera solaris TaxID=1519565 RepID=A0A1Z5K4L7_FISSO|nr:hypothetical protein FisN_26Lh153 [Fistulifera solaris]|eukprot:GAX21197.1 hypothetical protein FisN_26Lh153 [Fistulifera solaris]